MRDKEARSSPPCRKPVFDQRTAFACRVARGATPMMSGDRTSARVQTMLVHAGGWVAYGLISALGALPYRHAMPLVLYFTGTTLAAFLASFAMRALCRRLVHRPMSWPGIVARILACAYALGVLCSLAGACVEVLAGSMPVGWPAVLMAGVANAFSPAVVLVAWSALYLGVQRGREVKLREQQLLLAESLAREAELKALRYQITPHFLFNTLNGISTLVGEGDARSARRMIALLAGFLRSTLEPTRQGDVTIAQELAQVQQYIEIEQIRLGRRLVATMDCDHAAAEALVPHLLLQPLVENAIRHGIAPNPRGGTLALVVTSRDNAVVISVHNSVDGDRADAPHSVGVGLANTAARLVARYRDAGRFTVGGDASRGWLAEIEIPWQPAGEGRP
ncbi:sensor histidine kinase [Dyella telluris]|uniref:Histidine kinase n=1 Tax=Dyella telluris TaxID=2763498 RepID=A0A7G8Q8P3_9GAMM|nr:histidine kinase [Dyella telluris]QNK03151.1 histidine kinase [Dyella telluris]